MAETGVAEFGDKGQLGIVTKSDLLRLMLWAVTTMGRTSGHEPTELRRMIRRLKTLFSPIEAITLAEFILNNTFQAEEWTALAEELRAYADRPLFRQD